MKRVTVTVPDHVYQLATDHAAGHGRSLSTLVADFLRAAHDAEFARLEALQRELQAGISGFSASDRLGRDELHDRTTR